jgi:electron transport complex protein RnfE
MKLWSEFTKGLIRENPVFVMALGLCPALATSTTVHDAVGMGAAATFVLLGSNIIVSLVKNVIPSKVRIPCYIVVIATFVTIVELVMQAYLPPLYKSLGIFVPLIVVNCIILARAEAFASKNSLGRSILDAVAMGLGFTFALCLLATFREILGKGTFFGYKVIPHFRPAIVMILPPGAFLTLGLLMGYFNWLQQRKEAKRTNNN